jgi:hypothetical protein
MTETVPHQTNGTAPAPEASGAPSRNQAPGAPPEDDRGSVAADVRAVVENAVSSVGRAGTVSAAGVADAVEGAGRSLARRVVDRAVADPRHVPDYGRLAEAMAEKPGTTLLASGTAAAATLRILQRFGPLKALGKRTPAFLLATAVPVLVASVSRGAEELGLVASHLVLRAREHGVDPDPERVRRAAVQIVRRLPIDPDNEPSHGPLAVAWLRRAARAALPFTAGVTTADPEGLAAAAAQVDPEALRARP